MRGRGQAEENIMSGSHVDAGDRGGSGPRRPRVGKGCHPRTNRSPASTRPVPSPLVVHLLVAVSVLSGAATLLVPGLLAGPAVMNGSAKGTALVILLGGAPMLALAYRRARSGSLAASAVAAGAAAYLVYNAVLLVFATPFNRAFPLYEAMLGLAIWTLAGLTGGIWVCARQRVVAPGRWVAGFILGVVALNVAAWSAQVVPALLSDDPRSMLAGTGLTTNPVYVQDLAFWLPALAWVAIGMLNGHGPRTVLGASALAFWVLESASVAVDQWWGHHADPTSSVASATIVPLFLVVGAVTILPLASVLSSVAAAGPASATATRPPAEPVASRSVGG